MRRSLRALLAREVDLAVCGDAGSAEAALEAFAEASPDLVMIDVSLPGMNGIELAQRLRDERPELKLVMLSGHREQSHVDQALRAGALAYILKGNAAELPLAVRRVMQGERYLSPALAP